MIFQPPKGTKDFWGTDFYLRQDLANKVLKVMETYGFRQALTPMFESLELLAKDAGEEVTGQIYRITDKAGREFGLKSDITPAITRIVANQGKSQIKPIKISCFDRVYRYERPQKGRYREISQVNAEMFGVKSAVSDAELIRCLYDCYKAMALNEIKIIIGYRPLLESFISDLTSTENVLPVIRLIDKKNKIEEQEFIDQLKKLELTAESVMKIQKFISLSGNVNQMITQAKELCADSSSNQKYFDNLKQIWDALEDYEVAAFCELNLGLTRGSDYYTRIIFEVQYPEIKNIGSIGGGGRYDNLVEFYGGPKTPAVGFSIGINRIMDLLEILNKGTANVPTYDYYIASESNPHTTSVTRKLATTLRSKGLNVEVNLTNEFLSDQIVAAKKRDASFLILIKEDDLKQGSVKLIDLKTGQEEAVAEVNGFLINKI